MVKNVSIILVVLVQSVTLLIKLSMILKSTYTIKYTVNGEKEENKLVLKLEPLKGLLRGEGSIYVPNLTINGFKTDDFNELCVGTVNAKFSMEEISQVYKKYLKKRYRKEKKNFRLIEEKLN